MSVAHAIVHYTRWRERNADVLVNLCMLVAGSVQEERAYCVHEICGVLF
jgi:hypothetical protein